MADASSHRTSLRQVTADTLLVVGGLLFALAWAFGDWTWWLAIFGIVLVISSQALVPFKDQLARFRGAVVRDPTHEKIVSEAKGSRQPEHLYTSNSSSSERDASASGADARRSTER